MATVYLNTHSALQDLGAEICRVYNPKIARAWQEYVMNYVDPVTGEPFHIILRNELLATGGYVVTSDLLYSTAMLNGIAVQLPKMPELNASASAAYHYWTLHSSAFVPKNTSVHTGWTGNLQLGNIGLDFYYGGRTAPDFYVSCPCLFDGNSLSLKCKWVGSNAVLTMDAEFATNFPRTNAILEEALKQVEPLVLDRKEALESMHHIATTKRTLVEALKTYPSLYNILPDQYKRRHNKKYTPRKIEAVVPTEEVQKVEEQATVSVVKLNLLR